jgi:hypothetical protein
LLYTQRARIHGFDAGTEEKRVEISRARRIGIERIVIVGRCGDCAAEIGRLLADPQRFRPIGASNVKVAYG